ncbi:MAG TPA: MerR family transcriptional regulator [Clostridiaceae bacterium]
MNKDKENLLTIGVLASKVGVTVRTLQYYDTTRLLVPSVYSEGGRRLYSRHDIIRLQQILFLKSLGFSLDGIRDKLLPAESTVHLEQIFTQQKEVLIGQISHIQEAVNLMDKVITEIKLGSELDLDTLFAIMGAVRMDNPYSFMLRHFSKDQIDNFFICFENQADAVELNKTMQELFAQLIKLYQENKDPEGMEGQVLAEKWWNLVLQLTKGDPELIKNMFEVGENDENWPLEFRDLKEATTSFLGKALDTYLKNNN